MQELPKSVVRENIVLIALKADNFPILGETHGICAIAGYLRAKFNNINVKTFDLQIDSISDLITYLKTYKPSLVGLSLKFNTIDQFCLIYNVIKSTMPIRERPVIVVGNAIPTFNGKLLLKEYYSDIIVGIGEGEIILEDMYRYLNEEIPFKEVRNIMYLYKNEIRTNPIHYLESKEIVLPDRSNTKKFFELGFEVYIEGSRGCAYGNCTICSCSDFLGSKNRETKWRPRPIELIIEDLKILEEQGIKNVTFADEDFFGFGIEGVKRIKTLAEKIISSEINISFRMNACIKSIYNVYDSKEERDEKKEVVRLLKKAGLSKIFLGLESGSESQLKRYRKGFSLNEFTNALEIIKDQHIECEYGLILVDPLMNFMELKQSLSFIEENKYIFDIASVYKELRIQIGNSYINHIRKVEYSNNIKILGEFDFNMQRYKVIRYLDEDVNFYVSVVSKWVNEIHDLYYMLRILTRYSELNVKGNETLTYNYSIYFTTIHELRSLEFSLLKNLISVIEEFGRDYDIAIKVISEFEIKRQIIIDRLIRNIKPDNSFTEISELYKAANEYLSNNNMQTYKTELQNSKI